jgi:hypothetical protein
VERSVNEIERLDREISEMKVEMSEMRADIKQLLQIANIGQGVLWTVLRVGAVAAIIIGALAWLWDHVSWK